MSDELIGYAIDRIVYDHTFVATASGKRWHCCGSTNIKNPKLWKLSTKSVADTDIDLAECLSKRRSPTSSGWRCADLVYFRDGFCHQMANRILHPAEIIVSGAKGFRFTLWLHGLYGRERNPKTGIWGKSRDPWRRLSHCLAVPSVSGQANQKSSLSYLAETDGRSTWRGLREDGEGFSSFIKDLDDIGGSSQGDSNGALNMTDGREKQKFDRALIDLYRQPSEEMSDSQLAREQLQLMIKTFAPGEIDVKTEEMLAAVQDTIEIGKQNLLEQLENKKITPREYYKLDNKLTKKMFSEYRQILGNDRFNLLFGKGEGLDPSKGAFSRFLGAFKK